MIAVLICNENQRESKSIGEDCRAQIAELSNEQLNLSYLPDDPALEQAANMEIPVNLLYYDFQERAQVSGPRSLKRKYGDALVMMITDATVSPLSYLRPGIAPDALLLRPIQDAQLRERNREFVQSYLERLQDGSAQDSFMVVTREETTVVPYSHIYYFEAREKKMFLRTQNEEYAFYGTIDALEKTLPSDFRRCHRSYIVNLKKLVRVVSTENYLELVGQLSVPISRSYKSALKGMLL